MFGFHYVSIPGSTRDLSLQLKFIGFELIFFLLLTSLAQSSPRQIRENPVPLFQAVSTHAVKNKYGCKGLIGEKIKRSEIRLRKKRIVLSKMSRFLVKVKPVKETC